MGHTKILVRATVKSRLGAVRERRRRTRQMEVNNPPHLACLSAHLSEGWQRALESSHAPSRENRKVCRPWPRVLRGDKSSMHVTASSIGTNSKTGNIEFFPASYEVSLPPREGRYRPGLSYCLY